MAPLERLPLRPIALVGLGALVPLALFVLDRVTPVVAGGLSAISVVLIVGGLWLMWGPAEDPDAHHDDHDGRDGGERGRGGRGGNGSRGDDEPVTRGEHSGS